MKLNPVSLRYKVVKFGLKQRKMSKIAPFSLACLRGSETYGKLKGPVQKLFLMICFHLHKVYGGQMWTQTAKIEQNCSQQSFEFIN